jgi:hypothetical protein
VRKWAFVSWSKKVHLNIMGYFEMMFVNIYLHIEKRDHPEIDRIAEIDGNGIIMYQTTIG